LIQHIPGADLLENHIVAGLLQVYVRHRGFPLIVIFVQPVRVCRFPRTGNSRLAPLALKFPRYR
jgi:hypothetical protein